MGLWGFYGPAKGNQPTDFVAHTWLFVGVVVFSISLVASWLHTRKSRRQLRKHEETITELKAKLYEKSRQDEEKDTPLRALAAPRADGQNPEDLDEASTQLALMRVEMEASLRTLRTWVHHENLEKMREAALCVVAALADEKKIICLGSEDVQDHAAQLSKQLNQLGGPEGGTHAICLPDAIASSYAVREEDKVSSLLRSTGKAGDVLFLVQGDAPHDPSLLLRTAKEEKIHTIRLGNRSEGQAKGDVDIAIPAADDGKSAREVYPLIMHALVRLTQTLLSLKK